MLAFPGLTEAREKESSPFSHVFEFAEPAQYHIDDGGEQSETATDKAYRLAQSGYDAGTHPILELRVIRRSLTEEANLPYLDIHLPAVSALANHFMANGRLAFGESD